MEKGSVKAANDSTPHASLGNDEADHAGAFFSFPENPETTSQLADRLIERGLSESSREEIILALEKQGYCRLRGYWTTLERNGRFKSHVTLDDILEIERFNREVSSFLFAETTPVEVYLRAHGTLSNGDRGTGDRGTGACLPHPGVCLPRHNGDRGTGVCLPHHKENGDRGTGVCLPHHKEEEPQNDAIAQTSQRI